MDHNNSNSSFSNINSLEYIEDNSQITEFDIEDKDNENLIKNKETNINSNKNTDYFNYEEFISSLVSDMLFFLTPTFIGYLIYNTSKEGCDYGLIECFDKYDINTYGYLALLVYISSLCFYFPVILHIYFDISIYYALINFLFVAYIIISDILTNFKNIERHDQLNAEFLFYSLVFNVLLNTFCHYFLKIGLIYCNKTSLICLVATIFIILYWYFSTLFQNSCYYTKNGLSDSTIDESDYLKCNIKIPKYCTFNFYYYSSNNEKLEINDENQVKLQIKELCNSGNSNLEKSSFSVNNVFKIANENKEIENATSIDFPITNNWKTYPYFMESVVQKNIISNMTFNNKDAEAKIINNQLFVNVIKNNTLIEERKKLKINRKENELIGENLLIIQIGSMSKNQFLRKMKKTKLFLDKMFSNITFPEDYIKENMTYNELMNMKQNLFPGYPKNSSIYENLNSEVFQFFRYNSFGSFSSSNNIPINFGSLHKDDFGTHYLKHFKSKGFITGQGINFCGREMFSIDRGEFESYKIFNFDHELVSIYCDPIFTKMNSDKYRNIDNYNGKSESQCLYNRHNLDYLFDYTLDFFQKYQNENKLFRLGITDGFYLDANYENIDLLLYNFLNDFDKKGFLKNTYLMLLSDNGNNSLSFYSLFNFEDYENEIYSPFLYIIVPISENPNYSAIRQNLKINENRIVTPINVYNTILTILGDYGMENCSKHDEANLFLFRIEESFTCKNVGIPSKSCQCK